jgi:hypothetical protein
MRLQELILQMEQSRLEECKNTLETKGELELSLGENTFTISKDLMQIERVTKKETGRSVIIRLS